MMRGCDDNNGYNDVQRLRKGDVICTAAAGKDEDGSVVTNFHYFCKFSAFFLQLVFRLIIKSSTAT